MKIYNLAGEIIFEGNTNTKKFKKWFLRKSINTEISFIKKNKIFSYYELNELDNISYESFTMIMKEKKTLSSDDFNKRDQDQIIQMHEELREYRDNGLSIDNHIEGLGLFGAYEVLLTIEKPELFDKVPYTDYYIEEDEDYVPQKNKKLSKRNYLLSKKN